MEEEILTDDIELADTAKAAIGKEFGSVGTTNFSGMLSDIDYNRDWYPGYGSRKWSIIDEMRLSDGQVKGTLKYCKEPIVAADWSVEPASEDKQDVEIADFVSWNLFECNAFNWSYTLRHFLLALEFGVMLFEKIWLYDKATGHVYARLAPRLPKTIFRWNENEAGELETIEQLVTAKTTQPIPAAKAIVFTIEQEGGNWEGTSILRSAYKHWKMKLMYEKLSAMSYERFGMGVPIMKEPQAPAAEDREKADELLENLRANESAYARIPFGWEMEIVFGENWRSPEKEIRYHNEMISAGVIQQFTNLGSTETGSRAVGEVLQDPYYLSLEALADQICEALTHGLVHELVTYNWAGIDRFPQVKCSNIRAENLEVIADALMKLTANGQFITSDFETENHLRRIFRLPELAKPEQQAKMPEPAQDGEGVKASDGCACGGSPLALADGFRRALKPWEKDVNLAEIKSGVESGAQGIISALEPIRAAQMKAVAAQLAKMGAAGRIDPNKVTVPLMGKATAVVKKGMSQAYGKGKALVREELAKKKTGKIIEVRKAGDKVMKDISRTSPPFDEVAANRADMVVASSNDQMRLAALRKMPALLKVAPTADIEAFFEEQLMAEMETLSLSGLVLNCAGAIMESINEGRADQVAEMAEEFRTAYRSGILDNNICDQCDGADGEEFSVADAVDETLPDPECAGGDACRCLMCYVGADEEIAVV